MTLVKTNNGDGTHTLSFEYTAVTAKIQTHGDLAAENIFNNLSDAEKTALSIGLSDVFADLTQGQRGAILDNFVYNGLHAQARNQIHAAELPGFETTVADRVVTDLFDNA